MAREKKKQQKKRRKKKKKVNKLFVSAVAFFSAAVVVVFCIYYVYYETSYFNVTSIITKGNSYYGEDYIVQLTGIELGDKLFDINREKIKERLKKEVYINNVRVVYEIPDKVVIEITEKEEKYQVFFNNSYIVTDLEGNVLNVYSEKKDLLTIESSTNVIYNVGESVQFDGIKDINTIFDTLEYCLNEFGDGTITKLTVYEGNSIILDTEYEAKIKLNLDGDIKYQINFAMKIINDRLNKNLTVSLDLIDFTKGDSPVYIEDFLMEEEQ